MRRDLGRSRRDDLFRARRGKEKLDAEALDERDRCGIGGDHGGERVGRSGNESRAEVVADQVAEIRERIDDKSGRSVDGILVEDVSISKCCRFVRCQDSLAGKNGKSAYLSFRNLTPPVNVPTTGRDLAIFVGWGIAGQPPSVFPVGTSIHPERQEMGEALVKDRLVGGASSSQSGEDSIGGVGRDRLGRVPQAFGTTRRSRRGRRSRNLERVTFSREDKGRIVTEEGRVL